MVHLGRVMTDKDISDSKMVNDIDSDALGVPGSDEFTNSVYGSRFAAMDLPRHEMPEEEMPREIAYRMIKYAAATAMERWGGNAVTDRSTGTT